MTAPRRRRDAAQTRQLLLDAGRRRFASDGYAATTVRDIADDVGVNVALISRYFDSKEGLFEACLVAAVEELRQTTGELSLGQVAEAIAGEAVGFTAGEPNQVLLLLLRSSGDERADRIRSDMFRSFSERLAFVAGWQAGDPDGDAILLRAQIVMAVGIGMALLRSFPVLEPVASASQADLVAPLTDLVNALLPGPGR